MAADADRYFLSPNTAGLPPAARDQVVADLNAACAPGYAVTTGRDDDPEVLANRRFLENVAVPVLRMFGLLERVGRLVSRLRSNGGAS